MDGALSDIRSPVVRQGLDYWNKVRGERLMPARADLDPVDMIPLLPHVILFDVLRDPLDFRYRLIGTITEEHMAAPYTGRRLSEIAHQRAPSRIWSCCERVASERQPLRSDIPYVGPLRDFTTIEDIMMPLSADGESVDVIFIVVEYIRKGAAAAELGDAAGYSFG